MSFYVMATRLLRMWRFWLLAIVILGIVLGLAGRNPLSPVAKPCPSAPAYRNDVEPEARARIDALYELGLLYCADSRGDLKILNEPVYWGSDGTNSILFFQPETLAGVGVTEYAYGNNYVPSPLGDAPAPGFKPTVAGRPVPRNQAPPGASYFYREDGAPADDDYSITIEVAGTASENQGVRGRDFWRDLDRFVDMARRREVIAGERTGYAKMAIPIVPDRWKQVRARTVETPFASEKGLPSTAKLKETNPSEPALYQVVSGPLGSTVWVAGIVSGTTPVLALAPTAGSEIAPRATTTWYGKIDRLLVSAAFPPQATGTPFELRLWQDAESRARGEPPDRTWPIEFPSWPPAKNADG